MLLGIGIGWILGVLTMYFLFSANYGGNASDLNDKVDIYIDSVENLSEVLYQNGVIQDKKSFEEFLKLKKLDKRYFTTGKKVSFRKAMTYEEIFNVVYKRE
ncbi:hypothetical protein [Caldicellulosiruptor naganoensis]|uniref:Uncharacterized protein n=1 Tax=Caldicellulosiruptor naganoensis TaxID=29324 RepID=A0ABY7BK55_9FIRM|nr:hypothetical protein [Caldicellulosiruptor naganoensis]WAM32130.1 hypothetical protein OTJ99_000637 [Caldicellulosiruptor naganoensis]